MLHMKYTILFTGLLIFGFIFQSNAQFIISEVSPTNYYQLADEDDDYPDWIEIFNPGPTDQNLLGLILSDNDELKWAFPDHTLAAGERMLVFASGKNRGGLSQSKIDHWETA